MTTAMDRILRCHACGYPRRWDPEESLLGKRCRNPACQELLDQWEAKERWSVVPMTAPYYPPRFPR